MANLKKTLFATAGQKIISFLVDNAGNEFTEKDISKATGVKKSATNLALRKLAGKGLVDIKKVGRSSLCKIKENNFVAKEIKVLQNILILLPLLEKLKPVSQKIILFGSAARGENNKDSDVDLFVQTNNLDEVKKIIFSSNLREKLQFIVKAPKDMLKINKSKPLLFQEIKKGKIIWETYSEFIAETKKILKR